MTLNTTAAELQSQHERADTDPTKPIHDAATRLADRGLALVLAFRKQEAAPAP